MLHISILILQSTIQYTTAVTLPHVTYYWKTTEDTDKVPDYWNHGPINIPGLEDIFTITTKSPNIFPPWLTRRTESTTVTELSNETTEHATPISLPKSTTTRIPTTTMLVTEKIISTSVHSSTPQTQPTQHKATTNMLSTDFEYNEGTDPFSVFLRKIFKSLSTKSLPELPVLIEPIVANMEKLLHNNELQWLDDMVPYVRKVLKHIRTILSSASPGKLHTKCYQVYAMLSNHSALETDMRDLLTTLDDMYTEAEEEHMQRVLDDVIRFPNTDKTAQAIAHEAVYKLILFPMKRVLGTSKGKDMLLMLKSVIEKRGFRRNLNVKNYNRASTTYEDNEKTSNENDVQHSVYNFRAHETHTKEKTISPLKSHTGGIYQTVRNNIDDINSLMKNVELSSSETNEYELSSLESEEIIKESTVNINALSLRSNKNKTLLKGSLEELYEEYKENNSSSETIQYELSSSLESEEKGKEVADNINTLYFQRNKSKALRNGSLDELYKGNQEINFSSETLQYELSSSLESEEVEEVADNINILNFRSNKDKMLRKGTNEELYKKNMEKLRNKKYEVKSDSLASFFNKYDVIPRVPNENYRRRKIKNKKPTILVPEWPLWTKIIKDFVMKYEDPQNIPQHKLRTSGSTYIKEDRKKAITKPIKELRNKSFSKKPLTITNSSRHPLKIIYQTTKNTSFNLKRKPNNPTIGNSRIQNGYMNITKHNAIGEYINIAHQNVKELEDRTSNTTYSSGDTGDQLQNNYASRVKKTLSSALQGLKGREKNKMHQKRSRNHRHRNKHEKSRHKHGHRHSHYKKRKYENLKRKYQKLKQLLAKNRINDSNIPENDKKLEDLKMKPVTIKINYHKTFPSLFVNLNQRATSVTVVSNKQNAGKNTYLFTAMTQRPDMNLWLRHPRPEKYNIKNVVPTTKVEKEDLEIKKINMFLDDYDYGGKLDFPQFKTPFKEKKNTPHYKKTTKVHILFNGERIFRKSFPQNATIGKGSKSSEDSDAEKELKKNMYDAFRHMDFNVSRSYHNDTTSKVHLQESQETDVEAVLKSNIYKAVKKLLKK